jgi:siroheme synthase
MGKVFLVGAGPGDPELLTRKAARLLAEATIVLHDALVSREVLELISPRAERIDVGKRCGQKLLTQDEINSLLISYAASHKIVVRLKGGDPLIFGRAAEEMLALREAAIEFEVVPGITAALAAAASARISLTDRRLASQLLFITFSRTASATPMDWSAAYGRHTTNDFPEGAASQFAERASIRHSERSGPTFSSAPVCGVSGRAVEESLFSENLCAMNPRSTTLVIYMPGTDYTALSRWLQDSGLPADLPCAVISKATLPGQQLLRTTIAALPKAAKLPAPAILLVGRVAAQPTDSYAASARDAATSAFDLLRDSLPGGHPNVPIS